MTKLIVAFRNFANAMTVLEVFVDKVLNEMHGTIYRSHRSEAPTSKGFL
jgi:hypothetical protein